MSDVIKMAREAGAHQLMRLEGEYVDHFQLTGNDAIRAFAAIIRADMKERCAKVCETAEIPFDISVWHESTKKEMTAHTTNALASAIRAMED